MENSCQNDSSGEMQGKEAEKTSCQQERNFLKFLQAKEILSSAKFHFASWSWVPCGSL